MANRGVSREARPEKVTRTVFHLLLALKHRPLHGYALMEAVERDTEGALLIGPGSMYGCLARMEDSGLIKELPGEARKRGEDSRRRYYRLTALGHQVLAEEAATVLRTAELIRERHLTESG